ncbi:spore germination protein [Fictibacillus sp. KIGAM418]|uniref:Spore germination protein n=1 Tax=Fictibacillus marinisediminis TaxID=2878389 RepID=A0A9X1XAT9_9BACL|nr:endospore germination permease [Fictibacillus marinisediminis]MCK6256400.1 spore germination protein [Fictibacillus marinisediminis]
MKQTNKITAFQFYFFVLQTQVGIGVLSLPYSLFKAAKTDGWISMLIGGILVQIVTLFHWFLVRRFPDNNLFEINTILLGNIVGRILNSAYILYFTLVATLVAVLSINILKRWVYPLTPAWILIILFAVIALYFAKEDLPKIARFYVLVSFLLIILFLLTLTAFQNADVRYLFPIGQAGIKSMLLGSKEAILALLGFESLLIYAPFVKTSSKKKLKMVMLSNLTIVSFYVYITLTCLVFFSPDEFLIVPEPVLYLLKAIQYNLVERVDLVFLTIWVVSVITSMVTFIHIAGLAAKVLFKKTSHRPFIPFICLAVCITAYFPIQSDQLSAEWSAFMRPYIYFFIIILPVLLLGLSYIKKRRTAN